MPIPKPRKDEDINRFEGRCMADPIMNEEYPNQAQRFAICRSSWKESKK